MQVFKYPTREEWNSLLKRPSFDSTLLFDSVQKVLDDVRTRGDKAVKEYTLQFDGVLPESIEVTKEEIAEAEKSVSVNLKQAIEMARRNIWKFHSEQQQELPEIQTSPGVYCWQKAIAIEKVGLYVPDGTAPLFSTVLMLGIPAGIAECVAFDSAMNLVAKRLVFLNINKKLSVEITPDKLSYAPREKVSLAIEVKN